MPEVRGSWNARWIMRFGASVCEVAEGRSGCVSTFCQEGRVVDAMKAVRIGAMGMMKMKRG